MRRASRKRLMGYLSTIRKTDSQNKRDRKFWVEGRELLLSKRILWCAYGPMGEQIEAIASGRIRVVNFVNEVRESMCK